MYEDADLMEETTPEETDTPETTPEDTAQQDRVEPENQPEAPTYRVKYNGQEMELPVSDLITQAQKGMNYDHIQEDLVRTRQTSAEATSYLERLTSVLNQLGYTGSPQEIADTLEAQRREVEPEQVRREREAEEAQERARQEAEAARQEANSIRREAIFTRDLMEIQKLNPNVRSLQALGDTFFRLRAAGVSNLEAYELISKPRQFAKQGRGGKEHLITTDGGASSGELMDIPKGELDLWRESFPGDTPARLKERYNRARKRQGE
jgi:hypothetical protein